MWRRKASPFRGNPLSSLRGRRTLNQLYLTWLISCRCERGDLPAFLFRLRGTRKRNQGIDQCLHWSMKATYVAFGHDSSLLLAAKKQTPIWVSAFLVRERRLELPRRLTHAPQTCLSTCSSTLAYGRCFDSIESRLHHIGPPHLRQKSLYQSFRFCQGLFAISHLIKRGIAFHDPPSPL